MFRLALFSLAFRKFDFVDVWNFQLRGKDVSARFYSPSFKHSFCWWDRFNQYYGGEKITYLYFLWVKVEVIEKIVKTQVNLPYLDLVINRLNDYQRRELLTKLVDDRISQILDTLEVSYRLELERTDNPFYTGLEINLLILRDRQVWLKGELQPPSKDLYSLAEIITIECEIQTIDELFNLWEVKSYY